MLLPELKKIVVEPPELSNMTLDLLEEAYINSICLPKDYSKETAMSILRSAGDYVRRLSGLE